MKKTKELKNENVKRAFLPSLTATNTLWADSKKPRTPSTLCLSAVGLALLMASSASWGGTHNITTSLKPNIHVKSVRFYPDDKTQNELYGVILRTQDGDDKQPAITLVSLRQHQNGRRVSIKGVTSGVAGEGATFLSNLQKAPVDTAATLGDLKGIASAISGFKSPVTYVNSDGQPLVKFGDKFFVLGDTGELLTDPSTGQPSGNTTPVAVELISGDDTSPARLTNVAKAFDESDSKLKDIYADPTKYNDALVELKADSGRLNDAVSLADLQAVAKRDTYRALNVESQGAPRVTMTTSQDPDGSAVMNLTSNVPNQPATRLRNIAPAVRDTDAPNYGQVRELLSQRELETDRKINRGVASALAAAHLSQPLYGKNHNIAVAMGSYGGYSAMAIGYSHIATNAPVLFRGSLTYNFNKVGVGAGISYSW